MYWREDRGGPWLGDFGAFMASFLTEAARVLGAELLQVGVRRNSVQDAVCWWRGRGRDRRRLAAEAAAAWGGVGGALKGLAECSDGGEDPGWCMPVSGLAGWFRGLHGQLAHRGSARRWRRAAAGGLEEE